MCTDSDGSRRVSLLDVDAVPQRSAAARAASASASSAAVPAASASSRRTPADWADYGFGSNFVYGRCVFVCVYVCV